MGHMQADMMLELRVLHLVLKATENLLTLTLSEAWEKQTSRSNPTHSDTLPPKRPHSFGGHFLSSHHRMNLKITSKLKAEKRQLRASCSILRNGIMLDKQGHKTKLVTGKVRSRTQGSCLQFRDLTELIIFSEQERSGHEPKEAVISYHSLLKPERF